MSAFLQKVRYYSPTNEIELKIVMDKLLRLDLKESEGDSSKVAWRSIAIWLGLSSPFFKHHAFEGEAEWRKVISKDYRLMPGQQFRQGKSTLIPFVKVMLDVMRDGSDKVPQQTYFVDEVVVGPTPTPT